MPASQRHHALQEAIGADVALLDGGLIPGQGPLPNAFRLAQQQRLVGLLASRLVGGAVVGRGGEGARGLLEVNAHGLLAVIDADQPLVPAHSDRLADQVMRRAVEGALDFNVAVRMDRAGPDLEELEALFGQRSQGRLLDFQEVGQDLAASGAVNSELGRLPVPALEELVELLQALEAATLECVVIDVAAGPFLYTLLLGVARPGRQRDEAPVLSEGLVDLAQIWVVETGSDYGRLQVVVAEDARDPAQTQQGVLMGAQEAGPVLAPHRLLRAVPGTRARHPEDPGPAPAAAPLLEDQRPALEEVDLGLLPRRVLQMVSHLRSPPLQALHVALHGQVALLIAVELAQVLPNPLRSQPTLQPLFDEVVVGRSRRGRPTAWFLPHDRVGRFSASRRRVAGHRLPVDAHLARYAPVAPAQFKKRLDALSISHLEVVRHRRPSSGRPLRLPQVAGFNPMFTGRFWVIADRLDE